MACGVTGSRSCAMAALSVVMLNLRILLSESQLGCQSIIYVHMYAARLQSDLSVT
jgi:hypothetical protein